MIEAYVYSSCTSCRKAKQLLGALGTEVQRRDLVREPLTRAELEDLLQRTGLSVQDVLSRRRRVYRAHHLDVEPKSDEELIALMADEPTLIRRPIVIGRGDVVVDYNPSRLRDLVDISSEHPTTD